jgi:ribonucleoside-triphosphate reductase
VYNLLGHDLTQGEGVQFAVRALDFMRSKLSDFQTETNSIFNLEATPAEGTSYRLARIDKKLFPEIKVYSEEMYAHAGNGNGNGFRAPYYTNSTQLPVGFTDDVFAALKLQDPLQSRYTGGTVLHAFLGEKMPSVESTKMLVKTIAENFHLPYFSLTPTFSICEQHGYLRGEQGTCPTCGEVCEVWSRSVGYLRPVDQWNPGKQVEFKHRRTYDRQLAAAGAPGARPQPVEGFAEQEAESIPLAAHNAAAL